MAIGALLSSSTRAAACFASPLSSSSSSNRGAGAAGKQQHEPTTTMINYTTSSPHTRWPVCSQLVAGHRNGGTIRHVASMSTGKHQPLLSPSPTMSLCNNNANNAGLVKRRLMSRVDCFLLSPNSNPVTNGWHKPKNLTGLDTTCVLRPEYRAPLRKRRDCRAEQYEMAGSPSDVPAEAAVLVGDANAGVVSAPPWWQQFPKRWTIVVLCFFSFLLCNMDRVNMSIAILPMSAEFGWSPATVGLIQSSFFWGYLLTQILGGIWADRFGGKVVLGFGVVWWSIATILTPFAAKLGLPFLLVVRCQLQ